MGQLWARAQAKDSSILSAIRRGEVEELGRLVREGIMQIEEEEPVLCLAARLGQTQCVNLLLEQETLDTGQEDRSGFSPLVLAVWRGHLDTVIALTDRSTVLHNRSDRVDVNKVCSSGATAFDVALISGKFHIAERILGMKQFNVRTVSRPDLVDEQPLLMFCRRLNLDAVKLLLRAGDSLDIADEEGRSVLWHATLPNRTRRNLIDLHVLVRRVRGDLEEGVRTQLVRLLLDAGAKVTPAVLDNLASSLPKMRSEAEAVMRTPPSLQQVCRRCVWDTMRRGGTPNIGLAIQQLRHSHLPATLVDYLLYHKYK